MTTQRQFFKTLLAVGLTAYGLQAIAQSGAKQATAWPTQPLKIIVPFPPGGSSDAIARIIANSLGAQLKATVIVENRRRCCINRRTHDAALGYGCRCFSACDY
jgi:hypothetical protein